MGKRSKKRKKQNSGQVAAALNGVEAGGNTQQKMRKKGYEAELFELQVELVKLQEWVKATKARVVIIFEGRRRRERRNHQTHHRARQSPCVSSGGFALSHRATEDAAACPALH